MSASRKLKRLNEQKNKKAVRKIGQLQRAITELEKKLNDETDNPLTADERVKATAELNDLYIKRIDLIFKLKMPKDFEQQVNLNLE